MSFHLTQQSGLTLMATGVGDNGDTDADNDGLPNSVEASDEFFEVVAETFESDTGWIINPNGTDSATTGVWQRGNPQSTSTDGVNLQLDSVAQGSNALITGLSAGTSVGSNDIDGGETSARSPVYTMPDDATELRLDYYFSHLANATSSDFLRIAVERLNGTDVRVVVLENGSGVIRAAVWGTASVDVTGMGGADFRLVVSAADNDSGSLIEAGVDSVRIRGPQITDTDGDSIINRLDLDSDNDSIADVVEAGLADSDGNFIVDNLSLQGTVEIPPDSDADGIPDFIDLESNNSNNNASDFDITSTPYSVLDTSGGRSR